MRSVAAAICLFLLNIIGMGLGPQGVGILSDVFAAEYGQVLALLADGLQLGQSMVRVALLFGR